MKVYSKQFPKTEQYDVIVIGAGAAGATAAIAAARAGADTLLVERLPFLGGTSTVVLDTFYGLFAPGKRALRIVGGLSDELIRDIDRYATCGERPPAYGAGKGVSYHPEYLKVAWESLAVQAGVRILLNAWVQDVEVNAGRIVGLITATKLGLRRLDAKVFVDASGDADVCHFAGFDYEQASSTEPTQVLTTAFKIRTAGFDGTKSFHTRDRGHPVGEEGGPEDRREPRAAHAHASRVHEMTATLSTHLPSVATRDGQIVNATDPEVLSAAEIEGRRQAVDYVRFLKEEVAGYENAELYSFGFQVGIRETRRVMGDYRLTREDVLSARQFEDQIGLCAAALPEDEAGNTGRLSVPDGYCAGIPFRALIPKDGANILVAGRCYSAERDVPAAARSLGQMIAMGQAAGTAAALAAAKKRSPRDLDPAGLRKVLRAAGALVDIDDALKREKR